MGMPRQESKPGPAVHPLWPRGWDGRLRHGLNRAAANKGNSRALPLSIFTSSSSPCFHWAPLLPGLGLCFAWLE